MLFRLYNIPGVFQSYINSLLQEYLNVYYTAYLNNILIYSKNDKKYTNHMLKVLKQLWKKSLQLDINKYEFFIIKMKYLELIITIKSIRMNPKKFQTIINWESSILIKNMQAFLRFTKFY